MANIHPTAIVDPAAELDPSVEIGPYSIVGPNVKIGSETTVAAHCVVDGHTTLGRGNRLFPNVILGHEPQDLKYHGEPSVLSIGDHNDIRENVTMHGGTENGGGTTTVGSRNMIMIGVHVAHDSHIGDHVLIANNALLAGHITIRDYANLGGGVAIHHYVTIGRYAFIGGVSRIVHDCPPFMITDGHPSAVRGINLIGLSRYGFDKASIDRLKKAYLRLYKRGNRQTQLETIQQLEQELGEDEYIRELCRFARETGASTHGRQSEVGRRDDKRLTQPK